MNMQEKNRFHQTHNLHATAAEREALGHRLRVLSMRQENNQKKNPRKFQNKQLSQLPEKMPIYQKKTRRTPPPFRPNTLLNIGPKVPEKAPKSPLLAVVEQQLEGRGLFFQKLRTSPTTNIFQTSPIQLSFASKRINEAKEKERLKKRKLILIARKNIELNRELNESAR